jgi:hypothetical protein
VKDPGSIPVISNDSKFQFCHYYILIYHFRGTSRPRSHKTFEYSKGNSQLKYLNQKIVELEIPSTMITFSDISLYRLKKFSAPPFSDSIFELKIFLRILKRFMTLGPGIIKIPNFELDLVRYPQFCCENKMERRQTIGKFSRKMV